MDPLSFQLLTDGADSEKLDFITNLDRPVSSPAGQSFYIIKATKDSFFSPTKYTLQSGETTLLIAKREFSVKHPFTISAVIQDEHQHPLVKPIAFLENNILSKKKLKCLRTDTMERIATVDLSKSEWNKPNIILVTLGEKQQKSKYAIKNKIRYKQTFINRAPIWDSKINSYALNFNAFNPSALGIKKSYHNIKLVKYTEQQLGINDESDTNVVFVLFERIVKQGHIYELFVKPPFTPLQSFSIALSILTM
jgi:hypothetical protein